MNSGSLTDDIAGWLRNCESLRSAISQTTASGTPSADQTRALKLAVIMSMGPLLSSAHPIVQAIVGRALTELVDWREVLNRCRVTHELN